MRTTVTAIIMIAIGMLFTTSNVLYAQVLSGDTMFVYALPPGNLNTVIAEDTTANGQRNPNRVYVLQQTGSADTSYFITAPILTNGNLTVIGKPNPTTGHLPVIEPAILPDGSSPNILFEPNSAGRISLSNLYFLGWRTDDVTTALQVVNSQADSVSIFINKCVADGFNSATIAINSSYNNIFVTNTEFRDAAHPGGGASWINYSLPTDSVIFENDTFFEQYHADFGELNWVEYFRFEHNTCFFNENQPLVVPQLFNGAIKNNIFYALGDYGADSSDILTHISRPGFNQLGYAIINLDSLSTLLNSPYNLTEADRMDTVEDNVFFWPKGLYVYWTSVSDSAHDPGLLTPPVIVDKTTLSMFNNHKTWPGLYYANNDSVDPGFSSSLVSMCVDTMIKAINIRWTQGTQGGFRQSPIHTNPLNVYGSVPSNWADVQGYPVPENLKYTNSSLMTAGTDGKPLGDLNWFPNITDVKRIQKQTPTNYELSQNYPNPFNPTTIIKYSIPKSGFLSLKIYNILGQEISTLYAGFQKAGSYRVNFDASKLASGIYLYRLEANGFTKTMKMVLMK